MQLSSATIIYFPLGRKKKPVNDSMVQWTEHNQNNESVNYLSCLKFYTWILQQAGSPGRQADEILNFLKLIVQ